jgi:4-hydroxy-2-oxoheptanedioate aldolase
MYRKNRLKQKLGDGGKALGCWLQMASAPAAEIIGQAGFDCIIIDNEHGPGDGVMAISQMRALSASPATALVRVPWNDLVHIKRSLDAGAEGLMIPYINSAEEARAAADACFYPPAGNRGAALGAIRAADYGRSREEYLRSINDNLFIILQIETVRAIEAIPEIAATDGVDMLFIGPTDLSADIGKLGQGSDPELLALIERAEAAIKASGKLMGIIPFAGLGLDEIYARGYDLVMAASDVALLREGADAKIAAAAPVIGKG